MFITLLLLAALLAVVLLHAALRDAPCLPLPPPPADADAELYELSWRDCLELLLLAVLAFCALPLLSQALD